MAPHRTSHWLARQLQPALSELDGLPHELVPWETLAEQLRDVVGQHVGEWLEHRPSVDA